ncbi:protein OVEREXPRESSOR OF CATIONIC PEROXIDASE 3-like [Populus trichocarpa]|uniref:protein OVEREXPRESSOR OF CATIONIC PEROXIDASE 3-like n=1 Tax=Populus trichocarpa TaxID=3694 RepID=UPI0022775EE5|nr:protein OVEREXPRESSOR OF CATIONIC PEROXIDASE 3-like [Populus trichocarpa]
MALNNRQPRRLARALKTGHCKNSVKSLAAELCLDRAAVLDLLRDTPLNLVMMSAALPDEPAPTLVMLETLPIEIVPEETGNVNVTGLR